MPCHAAAPHYASCSMQAQFVYRHGILPSKNISSRLHHDHVRVTTQCHTQTSAVVRVLEKQEHNIQGITLEACSVAQAVASTCCIDGAAAQQLVELGAVYWGEEIKGQNKTKWRRIIQHPGSAAPPALQPGTKIRCHPKPKRFPACHTTDWQSQVLHLDDDYLVLNKPAGLPCMAHESNGSEEVAGCAGRALGISSGLEVGHRLDQWTTGVLVLTRNKEANRTFKAALQDKQQVTKIYKALTWRPVPVGPLEHYMYDGPFNEGAPVLRGGNLPPRGPRLLSHTHHPGWRLCSLKVLDCRASPSAQKWVHKYGIHPPEKGSDIRTELKALDVNPCDGADRGSTNEYGGTEGSDVGLVVRGAVPDSLQVYEVTIQLLTGRTHQIRAQLAAIGCALVGDVMYQEIQGLVVGEDGVLCDPELIHHVETLPQLNGRIGLHAWQMSWAGQTYFAPFPWQDDDNSQ